MDPKELRALAKARAEQAERLEELARLREREAELMKELGLTARQDYATIPSVESSQIVAFPKKRRGPPSEGIVTDLAKDLGFPSMKALADAIGATHGNARSWNHRGSIPKWAAAKIAELRAKRDRVKV